MDTQQITAPPYAQPGHSPGFPGPNGGPRDVTPTSGVIHVNTRHASGFVIIGNHLAQHDELSLVAIGLAVHIQSLPAGAKVGIKVLTDRFPESEARIAAALRELEAKGYLHRSRVRLPEGRVVTRTVSYNQPVTDTSTAPAPQPRRAAPARRATPPEPQPTPAPCPAASEPVLPPAPVPVPAPAAPPPPPHTPTNPLHRTAATLLADLRRHAPELTLSEGDIRTLTPGVATWLERDAHPDSIRHALTADLPVPLKHPAKLLRHRITTRIPAPLPSTTDLTAPRRKIVVIPLQNCETCERAFRATHPGHCRDCRTDTPSATNAP
ncbi:helix-turn-helix domain-containing protein [Streptomyces sp. NPDC058221]|uniref:helix-turn-helix domain-containing protein n=1 Tax=Streptomyces sp. NPDC058221 TaxID=3346388 RepID=UPI0036E88179